MTDPEPERVAGREKDPEITASVTDDLREEDDEVNPSEQEEAKRRRSLKPLIAIMTATTSKADS